MPTPYDVKELRVAMSKLSIAQNHSGIIIPSVCSAALSVVNRSILQDPHEIAASMKLIQSAVGATVCFAFKNKGPENGSSMHAPTLKYSSFSMHTHPLVAYCTAKCNLGHPSGDDQKVWYLEAHDTKALPAVHFCFAIEGCYIVHVRPLFLPAKLTRHLAEHIMTLFASKHNTRSTDISEPHEQTQSQPKVWCDDANSLTWRELAVWDSDVLDALGDMADEPVFEVYFIPNVITYKNKMFLGEIFDSAKKGKYANIQKNGPFYKAYLHSQVEEACQARQRCPIKGDCDIPISNVELVDGVVYGPQHITDHQLFQQDVYNRLICVISAHTKYNDKTLEFNEAIKFLGLHAWLFSVGSLQKVKIGNSTVRVIPRDQNEQKAAAELLLKVKDHIRDITQKLQNKNTADMYGISQEQVKSMAAYYLSDKFEVHELPSEAWFVDLSGHLVWKKTGLHGLNRPEGVNYDKIFEAQAQGKCKWGPDEADPRCPYECESRTIFLSLSHVKGSGFGDISSANNPKFSDLVAHEVAHVDDMLWMKENHGSKFENLHESLRQMVSF